MYDNIKISETLDKDRILKAKKASESVYNEYINLMEKLK